MNQKEVKRNLRLYFWFQVLREPLFWGPILILYLQNVAKMSLGGIYLMEAAAVAVMVFLDVPTGALADLIGRRKTVFWGTFLLIFDTLFFALAESPAWAWTADMVWAVGAALVSGADSSLLYDTLKAGGQAHKFKLVEGRAMAARLITLAFTSLLVGYLAKINLRLPLYLSLPFLAVNAIVTYNFLEPPRGELHYGWKKFLDTMKLSILFVANNRKIKWIIGYVVTISVVSKIWFFSYNPYFELVSLPLEYYGWLFFGMNVIAAAASFWSDRISKWLPEGLSLVLMIALLALPIIAMASWIVMPMVMLVLLQNMVRGYLGPFISHFLHDHLSSERRATMMSIKSTACNLGQFVFMGAFGLTLGALPLTTSMLMLGIGTLVIGFYLLATYKNVFGAGG